MDAEKVSLARLSWDRVQPLLTARRFDTGGWSEEVRNVLCTPQHLAMFIEHSASGKDTPAFPTYQGLLDRVIERLCRMRLIPNRNCLDISEVHSSISTND